MHEMHLVKDLFADLMKLAKENNVKKITRVYISMGEFTEINEDIVRFFFKENAKDTAAEGADIEITKSPARQLKLLSFDCE
ncbi:MAG: hypothetical protein DRG59_11730 [Deltaproteobacteria bacterium]|nr:MAG: hypothetical protein DRG59_11730 [Deltaproteobacteria bacterium]